jgi:nodulation protein E
MNRVVVTGLGVFSALGKSARQFSETLQAGKSAIGALSTIRTEGLQVLVGAEVRDYDPERHFDHKKLPLLDRVSQFALLAAREAVAASGLDFRNALGGRTAVIIGSGSGGQGTLDDSYFRL